MSSLPATADCCALYVTSLLVGEGKRVTTASRRLASIVSRHRDFQQPIPDVTEARAVICAVRRDRKEQPQGKAPLNPRDLLKIARACNGRTNLGSRDRALVVLGFATSLRRSDLAELRLSDISFERKGLAVVVRYSKTDQEGRGRVIGVWAGKRPQTDPVRVLRAWIRKRGKFAGPLFCRIQTGDTITERGMTGQSVCDVVKRVVERAGLDPASYGAHSLRAGSITAAADLGRSDQEIMEFSGHESAAVMRMYVRGSRVFAGRNPLAGVL